MTPKELKRLAKTCRDVGIKQYKCAEFEFVLTDEAPLKVVKHPSKQTLQDTTFETDTPTNEELLFWSSQGMDSEPSGET